LHRDVRRRRRPQVESERRTDGNVKAERL
jgi:hypothetical protein